MDKYYIQQQKRVLNISILHINLILRNSFILFRLVVLFLSNLKENFAPV